MSRVPAAASSGGPSPSPAGGIGLNSKPRGHSTNPFLNAMANGNGNGHGGNGEPGHSSAVSVNFFGNGTLEQVTPTSSVDTEDGGTGHPEEAECGVEGDAEASDDDHLSKLGKH